MGALSPRVTVIIPTRGLVVAQCITSVLSSLKDTPVTSHIVLHSGDTIPDCFNKPIYAWLARSDYIWLVEEDVEVPYRALSHLLAADADIAAIDYPFPNGYGCVAWYEGKPMWTGTGCTLIKREVFERMTRPWFRTDIHYIIDDRGGFHEHLATVPGYGGHDIRFGLMANSMGMSIKVVPSMTAKHWKMVKEGKPGDNTGKHEMRALDWIQHTNILKKNPVSAVRT